MLHNQDLSTELWLLILELLDQPSLKAFAAVSRHMHALATPILYSKIDLSVHNISPHVTAEDRQAITQKVFGQQSLFMEQIFDRPQLASMVRSFTWTMCEIPQWAQKEGHRAPIHQLDNIYTLYRSLNRVKYVDISGGDLHDYPCLSLPPLFPEATHIRLSGQMHYSLASAILHGLNHAPLECLALENMLERGRFETGENYEPQYEIQDDPSFGYRLLLPLKEKWSDDGSPVQVAPGEMTGLLNPMLRSRCSRLRQFTFSLLDITRESRLRILPPGWRTRNLTLHDELITFIQAVHPPKLRLLYAYISREQYAELESRWWQPFCVRTSSLPSGRWRRLLQTLCDGWPGLQTLEIRGGDRYTDLPFGQEEPLPNPMGCSALENVEVCFEPSSCATYQGRLCNIGSSD